MKDLIIDILQVLFRYWLPAYIFCFILLVTIFCVVYLFDFIFEVIL